MQRTIIIALVIKSSFAVAGDWHMGGRTADKIKEAVHEGVTGLNVAVREGVTGLKDIQNALPQTAAKAGDEFGKNVVKGGISEIRNQGNAGKEYVIATGAALLAIPYAPYVLAGAGVFLAVGGTVKATHDYREFRFRRCLNKHFTEALNEKGFPTRCESPERRLSWWSEESSTKAVEHYRNQKKIVQKITKVAPC